MLRYWYLDESVVRSLTRFALIGLLIGSSGVTFAPAQEGRGEGQYTIGVDVDLAVFNLTVTDSKGRHVTGLKAGDFHVYEDNRLQDIKLFTAEDIPATVGLIVDSSGSMRDKRADVVKAAIAFADASNAEDEMFVVNFNEKAYVGLPSSIKFTNDADQIRAALVGMVPAGLTALYDAMAVGLDQLKAGTRNRKALVVLSDGGDNASHRRLDDVLQIAQRSSATIYTIGIYDVSDQDKNPRVLRKIAEASGGRAYFPDTLKDLDQVWRDIAGGIRSQYTIGYHSTNVNRDGSYRKVKITAGHNGGHGLKVVTRDGYTAPSDKPVPR